MLHRLVHLPCSATPIRYHALTQARTNQADTKTVQHLLLSCAQLLLADGRVTPLLCLCLQLRMQAHSGPFPGDAVRTLDCSENVLSVSRRSSAFPSGLVRQPASGPPHYRPHPRKAPTSPSVFQKSLPTRPGTVKMSQHADMCGSMELRVCAGALATHSARVWRHTSICACTGDGHKHELITDALACS